MESKLEYLSDAISAGVMVNRTGPFSDNGYIWRITFLDDSPASQPDDFKLELASETLYGNVTGTSQNTNVMINQLAEGKTHGDCTGSHVVPSSGGLTVGTFYYARVQAVNSLGYSNPPQVGDRPWKPMVPPGPPTSVSLSVTSEDSLRVVFSQPNDHGGDEVSSYVIMHADNQAFENPVSIPFHNLAGGAPYFKTVTGLEPGQRYYFKVFAVNLQGPGVGQPTTPPFLNPAQEPGAPTNVAVGVTSDSMLTVSFSPPTSNGGDEVRDYIIEWDTTQNFNSASSLPFKGSATVDAARHRSHTIQLLGANTKFYVRVAAINSIGRGAWSTPSPAFEEPTKQVPGKPQTAAVQTGSLEGTITMRWQYPRIPHHGIPCSGDLAQPEACPFPFGGSEPESTGGDAISQYEVEYNEVSDFTGQDGGTVVTDATTLTLSGLTSGREYFIRVLARNTIGSGEYCSRSGVACPDSGNILSALAM